MLRNWLLLRIPLFYLFAPSAPSEKTLDAFRSHQTFEDEHLVQLSKECALVDMLAYDDTDRDGHLNINEFYTAFSKLYSKR